MDTFAQYEQKQKEALRQMKSLATALLLLMVFLFFSIKYLEKIFPNQEVYLQFIRAFAEAAMVGAIADWFAVTALFRRPLGLPIPHTAIIPTKKDSIGRGLGNFVSKNFLTAEALQDKLANFEISKKIQDWLAVEANSELVAEKIATFVPSILNTLKDEEVREFIEKNIALKVSGSELAKLLGDILSILTAQNKHYEFFNEVLRVAEKLLEENKTNIRKHIREESPWLVRAFVANKVYEKIIAKAESTFEEISKDPAHPLRQKFHKATEDFIHQLRTSPELHQRLEALKDEFLSNPIVHRYFEQVWQDLKNYIIENISDPHSAIRQQLQLRIYKFFNNLTQDEIMRKKITNWLYSAIIEVVSNYRMDIGNMIAETIKSWDKETMVNKLELQVGKDLQYIRISGTLVGGAVGFLLHLFSFLTDKFFIN
ncbi:MAG: DUF445 domain-containing protein [Bacteroidia bacterium]|nr:DUF445 domain-containing protein [Bacteroidia bacterium]MDW8159733.1 DUF445 domain-containing protein [Bacteroidia bacterium]